VGGAGRWGAGSGALAAGGGAAAGGCAGLAAAAGAPSSSRMAAISVPGTAAGANGTGALRTLAMDPFAARDSRRLPDAQVLGQPLQG
jgi:hypothetical protein